MKNRNHQTGLVEKGKGMRLADVGRVGCYPRSGGVHIRHGGDGTLPKVWRRAHEARGGRPALLRARFRGVHFSVKMRALKV